MASSKVMSTNPDPTRVQSPSTHYQPKPFSSINMDQIIHNIYDPNTVTATVTNFTPPPPPPPTGGSGEKSADEVWKQIVSRREPEMTLDDFLTKVGGEARAGAGNGTVVVGNGRGKRRAVVEEPVLDKATQQKQKRMIKNRESAARSRERKQAYTVELEALVTQLEEENARLVRQEAEESRKRFKQLMENLIPVEDERKPPRRIQTLRRSNSGRW